MKELMQMIDWSNALTDIISSLIVALVTALVGLIFVKKYFSQLVFSNKMKELGFLSTTTNKQTRPEIRAMCERAREIKIIYVSGIHYMTVNEKELRKALARGAKVKFLCCDPNSIFLRDIENMEYHLIDGTGRPLRAKDKKIADETWALIERFRGSGLEMRFYSSEYRMPCVLAYHENGDITAWLTVTLPPYKSTKSFVLRGEKKNGYVYDTETNFIEMMETHFDTIWEHASKSVAEVEAERTGKEE